MLSQSSLSVDETFAADCLETGSKTGGPVLPVSEADDKANIIMPPSCPTRELANSLSKGTRPHHVKHQTSHDRFIGTRTNTNSSARNNSKNTHHLNLNRSESPHQRRFQQTQTRSHQARSDLEKLDCATLSGPRSKGTSRVFADHSPQQQRNIHDDHHHHHYKHQQQQQQRQQVEYQGYSSRSFSPGVGGGKARPPSLARAHYTPMDSSHANMNLANPFDAHLKTSYPDLTVSQAQGFIHSSLPAWTQTQDQWRRTYQSPTTGSLQTFPYESSASHVKPVSVPVFVPTMAPFTFAKMEPMSSTHFSQGTVQTLPSPLLTPPPVMEPTYDEQDDVEVVMGKGESLKISQDFFRSTPGQNALKAQLEWYFSSRNLMTDTFLVSRMNREKYIPISVIADFKLVKAITTNMETIVETLRSSSIVTVDESGTMVKPNTVERPRDTVVLRDLPADATEEDIASIFKDGEYTPKTITKEYGNTWFIEFTTAEEALTMLTFTRGKRLRDVPVAGRLKSTTVLTGGGYNAPPPPVTALQTFQTHNTLTYHSNAAWQGSPFDVSTPEGIIRMVPYPSDNVPYPQVWNFGPGAENWVDFPPPLPHFGREKRTQPAHRVPPKVISDGRKSPSIDSSWARVGTGERYQRPKSAQPQNMRQPSLNSSRDVSISRGNYDTSQRRNSDSDFGDFKASAHFLNNTRIVGAFKSGDDCSTKAEHNVDNQRSKYTEGRFEQSEYEPGSLEQTTQVRSTFDRSQSQDRNRGWHSNWHGSRNSGVSSRYSRSTNEEPVAQYNVEPKQQRRQTKASPEPLHGVEQPSYSNCQDSSCNTLISTLEPAKLRENSNSVVELRDRPDKPQRRISHKSVGIARSERSNEVYIPRSRRLSTGARDDSQNGTTDEWHNSKTESMIECDTRKMPPVNGASSRIGSSQPSEVGVKNDEKVGRKGYVRGVNSGYQRAAREVKAHVKHYEQLNPQRDAPKDNAAGESFQTNQATPAGKKAKNSQTAHTVLGLLLQPSGEILQQNTNCSQSIVDVKAESGSNTSSVLKREGASAKKVKKVAAKSIVIDTKIVDHPVLDIGHTEFPMLPSSESLWTKGKSGFDKPQAALPLTPEVVSEEAGLSELVNHDSSVKVEDPVSTLQLQQRKALELPIVFSYASVLKSLRDMPKKSAHS